MGRALLVRHLDSPRCLSHFNLLSPPNTGTTHMISHTHLLLPLPSMYCPTVPLLFPPPLSPLHIHRNAAPARSSPIKPPLRANPNHVLHPRQQAMCGTCPPRTMITSSRLRLARRSAGRWKVTMAASRWPTGSIRNATLRSPSGRPLCPPPRPK